MRNAEEKNILPKGVEKLAQLVSTTLILINGDCLPDILYFFPTTHRTKQTKQRFCKNEQNANQNKKQNNKITNLWIKEFSQYYSMVQMAGLSTNKEKAHISPNEMLQTCQERQVKSVCYL